MPSNSTGRWVERAASTGGGRTYRGQTPVNWYLSLLVICLVGLGLIVYSRYQNSHSTASASGPPTTAQTWYAALGTDICGTMQPNLQASTNTTKTGLTTDGSGVVTIHPKNSSESGKNATLGKFVSEYGKGLVLTNTTLAYPGKSTYANGDVCPKGTPDAGKQGVVVVDYWPNFTSNTSQQPSGNPQDLLFSNGQLITMAFVPADKAVPKPSKAIAGLLQAINGQTPTSTTTPGSTTATTAPSSTPTTAPSTATTTPLTATTATPGTRAPTTSTTRAGA
jgi:hypothetical protein